MYEYIDEDEFIDHRSLLMKVSVDQLTSRDVKEALGEYQRLIYRLEEANQTLSELNQQLWQMDSEGKEDSDEYSVVEEKVEVCVEEIDMLDSQIITLEQNEYLENLYNQLLAKARAESIDRVKQIQVQRRIQKEREYEEFIGKHREERMKQEQAISQNQLNAAAQELAVVEKEIEMVRHQLRQINEDISQLKFAFWGERKRHKQELEQIRALLNNRLTTLYKLRSQI